MWMIYSFRFSVLETDHSYQRIWTKFGMGSPHNLQIVTREFL